MKKEYYSKNGLWLIITTGIIYLVTIYFMLDNSIDTIAEYLPFIGILALNSAMLLLYGRELFSKKPLLILEEDKMTIRGMLKTHIVNYEDIQKIQRTYNGSKKHKQVNRIGIKLKDIEKPIYIVIQSIDYDPDKLFEDITQFVYKKRS